MPQLTCGTCGIEFYKPPSLVHKTNYCSKECRIASYPPRLALTCDVCGKSFERAQCFVGMYRRHYCSRECANEGHKRLNTVQCAVCGKSMTRRDCEVRRSEQPFCSRACYGIWASKRWNKQSDIPCAQCGKALRRRQYKLISQEHQFCSRTCQHAWQSENWIGENSPHWEGGAIPGRDYGPNWKQQAHAARQRDGYKCRVCGVSQKRLHRSLDVHHVRSFRQFGYIRGQNNAYKEANELTNLVSLCRLCHARVENGLTAIQPYLL